MRRILLAAALLVCAAVPAAAQLANEPPETLVRDALDAPYGRAMLARFAAAAEKTADVACRRERGLDAAAVAAGLRDVMERYAMRMATGLNESHDEEATAKAFAASAGANAAAELARLARDPDVMRYEELARPELLGRFVTLLFEGFDHYITVGRLNVENLTPVARGEPDPLPEDPTAATEEAVEAYVAQSSSAALQRYLEFVSEANVARARSMKIETMDKLLPMALFAGADRDLAALCIGKK
jgi:hypothetical protein